MHSQVSGRHAPVALLIAAFAAVYIIWGSTYLGIKIAIETMPPLLMAGGRFIIAGTLMYAWMRGIKRVKRPQFIHWRSAFIVGGLLLLGGNGLISWAQQYVPSGLAALLVATVPMWMVLLDWLKGTGPRPSVLISIGLVLGLLGVFVLFNPTDLKEQPVHPIGAAVVLAACVSWAIGSLYARKAPLPREILLATGMEMIGGGLLLLIAGSLRGEWSLVQIDHITLKSVAALAYLIFVGAIVGYTAYIWLLQVVSPAAVSTYAFVNPVVAVFLGWLFANESIGWRTIIAATLIVAAVVLITMRRAKKPPLVPPRNEQHRASQLHADQRTIKPAAAREPALCGTASSDPQEPQP